MGGGRNDSVGTLSRWSGTVYEWDAPSNDQDDDKTDCQSALSEYLRYHSEAHLQNASFYSKEDPGSIKKAVMENGAVVVAFAHDSEYDYKNSQGITWSYYCPVAQKTNHAVLLVGWDDHFSKSNFGSAAETTPQKDGAWLCRNSWGSGAYNEGYFWISYEDATLNNFYSLEMEPAVNYGDVYQHDSHWGGNSYYSDYGHDTANVYTARKDDFIEAVGFYTVNAGQKVSVQIYTDIDVSRYPDVTDGKHTRYGTINGSADFSKSFEIPYAGYHTIKLGRDIPIKKGESFSVIISYEGIGDYTCFDAHTSKSNTSFYRARADGSSWQEKTNADFCIKAYTKYGTVAEAVNITLDEPEENNALAANATADVGMVFDVGWTADENKAETAESLKKYTVHMRVAADSEHMFDEDTQFQLNGVPLLEHELSYNEFTKTYSITHTFPVLGSTVTKIHAPLIITEKNGTRPSDFRLPQTVDFQTDRGEEGKAVVAWNMQGLDYDMEKKEAQEFDVSGTVKIPVGLKAAESVSLNISIHVTVLRHTIDLGQYADRVRLSETIYVYDGNEKRPQVTIEGLKEGTDYQVSYSNNVCMGNAEPSYVGGILPESPTVVITGIGGYSGSVTKRFTILAEETEFKYSRKAGGICIEGTVSEDKEQKELSIPDSIGGYPVKQIAKGAFWNYYGLQKIDLPDSIEKINREAFAYCYRLKQVDLPQQLTTIGERAFYHCNKMAGVYIPPAVTVIGEEAFAKDDGSETTVSLMVYGVTDSYAQNYAELNGIGFVKVRDVSELFITIAPAQYEKDGSVIEPIITVFDGNIKLEEANAQYVVRHEPDVEHGFVTVTIKCKGTMGYAGTLVKQVPILGVPIQKIVTQVPTLRYAYMDVPEITASAVLADDVTEGAEYRLYDADTLLDTSNTGVLRLPMDLSVEMHSYTVKAAVAGYTRSIAVEVVVNKGIPAFSENPEIAGVYGQKIYWMEITQPESTNGAAGRWVITSDESELPVVGTDKTYEVEYLSYSTNFENVKKYIMPMVRKAEYAPGMPEKNMTVPKKAETVKDVEHLLPEGWIWSKADCERKLEEGGKVSATAVYNGDDKGNYEVEQVCIEIYQLRVLLGDVDGDSKVALKDAYITLKAALNVLELAEEKKEAADANQDGKINLIDVRLILRKSLKLTA